MTGSIYFSLVVPMHRTAVYLPALLESLGAQRPGPYDVEFIFVDDGSPDDAADIAERWLAAGARSGRVLRQENRGVSEARNAGIAAATGDWIGFPDSDDFVGDRYLDAAARAILSDPTAVLVSTNVKWFRESVGRVTDNHVLRRKFAAGTRGVDLDRDPRYIQTQAASAFFRRDLILTRGTRFRPGLDLSEDAVFVADYLLDAPFPRVLCVADSAYIYRQRAAGDSAVDTAHSNSNFYLGRFDHGYAPVFEKAAARGPIPAWLDMTFIYDVSWFLAREYSPTTKATWLTADEKRQVLAALSGILQHIADRSILAYGITPLSVELRCLLLALKGSPLPDEGIAKAAAADGRGIDVRYLFQGRPPVERFTRGDEILTPITGKIRRIDMFDQDLIRERIAWLPPGELPRVELDGRTIALSVGAYQALNAQPLRDSSPDPKGPLRRLVRRTLERARAEIAVIIPGACAGQARTARRAAGMRARRGTRARQLLGLSRRFRHAWVLMDKVAAAGDSAEYLYRYLREHERSVNPWFVLSAGSADWARLRRDGFRLVGYGTARHRALLTAARVVLSTHLDVEVTEPFPELFYRDRRRPWRFVYLQHGVLQHDLSLWFNNKPIDIITTASIDEQESLVEDGSSYVLTSMQAKLTGFPRHDEVARLAAGADPAQRDIVLVAPTWRNRMHTAKTAPGALRTLKEPFEETEFGHSWLSFMNDPRLHAAAAEHRLRVVFLPHPNLRTQIDPGLLAGSVELMRSVDDVHRLLTRCRCVVTDYSSIAFEAALAGADVSYFQFDRDEFLHGGHTYLPGYWSYQEHGFGPVSTSVGDALSVVERQLEGAADGELYRRRVDRTLPMVDGRSSERITSHVKSLLTATSE